MSNSDIDKHNKKTIYEKLVSLSEASEDALESVARSVYLDDAGCRAFHPVNDLTGPAEIAGKLWRPLRKALPDLERRDSVLVSGEFEGEHFVAMIGHLQGTFAEPLFDIPATSGVVHIRYGEIHKVDDGMISKTYVIADMLDLMRQAGCWPIAPSVGAEGMWPGPATADGLQPDTSDAEAGTAALTLVRQMHGGLLKFDGRDLESMDHQQYWTRDFLWYGPSGIGTTRGLNGFRAHHQIPFLRAFPDRNVADHIGRVGDGNYVVTGGWPSVVATHTGPDWLALPPSGKRVGMRVMDFYRVENGLIAENWVPIDIIDVLRQLGVDVFDRMRHLAGKPRMRL